MSGARELDVSRMPGAAANQSGILPGDGALAKYAIGQIERLLEIESGTRQPSHPTMAKILAAVDMSLSTQLVPYDDHDDVLWEQEQRRSTAERARIAAELARLAREAT